MNALNKSFRYQFTESVQDLLYHGLGYLSNSIGGVC